MSRHWKWRSYTPLGGLFPSENNKLYKIVSWMQAGFPGLPIKGGATWTGVLNDTACRTHYWSDILVWKKAQAAIDAILAVVYEDIKPMYLIPVKEVIASKGWHNYLVAVEEARAVLGHTCKDMQEPLNLGPVQDYDAILVKSEKERKEMFGPLNPVLSSDGEALLSLPGSLGKEQVILFMKILRSERRETPYIFPSTFLLRSGMEWDQVKKVLGTSKQAEPYEKVTNSDKVRDLIFRSAS